MLRISLSIVVCMLFFAAASHAQTAIIPRVGMSFTNYHTNVSSFVEPVLSTPGATLGVGASFPLGASPWLSLVPEINYAQRNYAEGGIREYNEEEALFYYRSIDHQRKLHYIEVPLLVRASVKKQKMMAYLNVGPSIAYAVGGSYENTIGLNNMTEEGAGEFNFDYANRVDVSILFGGGVGIQIGPGVLQLDARYGIGFSNLTKDYRMGARFNTSNDRYTDFYFLLPNDQKSRILSFALAYSIPLK